MHETCNCDRSSRAHHVIDSHDLPSAPRLTPRGLVYVVAFICVCVCDCVCFSQGGLDKQHFVEALLPRWRTFDSQQWKTARQQPLLRLLQLLDRGDGQARPSPLVPLGTPLYSEKGY